MKKHTAITLLSFLFVISAIGQTRSDAALRSVTEKDLGSRDSSGKLLTLAPAEHLNRAEVYATNRQFPQAREHFQKILDAYPTDPGMAQALFGIARSYMWERQYQKAINFFDRLNRDYMQTKEGREGLAFKGACYVRLSKHMDAAAIYQQYIAMFPNGEKIESAHMNTIDSLREAGKYEDAEIWVDKAVRRFPGGPTATNALHAGIRMEIHRQNWSEAVRRADELLMLGRFGDSMTSGDEVKFLKGFALERGGRKQEAISAYSSIPVTFGYFSGLAAEKLSKLSPSGGLVKPIAKVSPRTYTDYPVMYRAEILRSARARNIDPRFVLSIMKVESSFKPNAKSPAAARGLLQLVFDTAIKYNKQAGYPNLQADDLYQPATNIAIGTAYMADLRRQFDGMYEAIAASYNGGEDNAARWLNRSKPKEPGIFASEVGFKETKAYVTKVMANYRMYRELYTEGLDRR